MSKKTRHSRTTIKTSVLSDNDTRQSSAGLLRPSRQVSCPHELGCACRHLPTRAAKEMINAFIQTLTNVNGGIKYRSTSQSILGRHSLDSRSTFDQQSVDSRPSVMDWSKIIRLSTDCRRLSTEMSMDCRSSVNRGATELSIEYRSSIDRGYRLTLERRCRQYTWSKERSNMSITLIPALTRVIGVLGHHGFVQFWSYVMSYQRWGQIYVHILRLLFKRLNDLRFRIFFCCNN